jgi:hypothetical protein
MVPDDVGFIFINTKETIPVGSNLFAFSVANSTNYDHLIFEDVPGSIIPVEDRLTVNVDSLTGKGTVTVAKGLEQDFDDVLPSSGLTGLYHYRSVTVLNLFPFFFFFCAGGRSESGNTFLVHPALR